MASLRGTANIGVLLDVDRGFIYIPRNVNIGTNLTPVDWCLQNNVQTLWRFKAGEKAFKYVPTEDVLTEVANNNDETLASNRQTCIEHSQGAKILHIKSNR